MITLEFGGQVLALTDEEFEVARLRGLEMMPPGSGHTRESEILDASGMEAATGVPATWWAQAAREGTVPYLKLGKYVRFNLRESLAAAKGKRRSGQ